MGDSYNFKSVDIYVTFEVARLACNIKTGFQPSCVLLVNVYQVTSAQKYEVRLFFAHKIDALNIARTTYSKEILNLDYMALLSTKRKASALDGDSENATNSTILLHIHSAQSLFLPRLDWNNWKKCSLERADPTSRKAF